LCEYIFTPSDEVHGGQHEGRGDKQMALSKTLLEEQSKFSNSVNQEWARVPRQGQTLEGHFRSSIFALIKSGEIKTASIKPQGASRTGMRLVFLPSLRDYNRRHMAGEQQGGE
jgi:hypothetical protein